MPFGLGDFSGESKRRNDYFKRKLKRKGIDVDKLSYIQRVRELSNARKEIQQKGWYRNYYGK